MAKYTVRINELVNYYVGESTELTYSEKVDVAAIYIINFSFPCYGTTVEEQIAFMNQLKVDIVRAYLMKEIGYETLELWRVQLETRLRMIMPKYKQLYETTLFELDIDNPYHIITTHEQESSDDRGINRKVNEDKTLDMTDKTMYGMKEQSDIGSKTTYDEDSSSSRNSDDMYSEFPQASFQQGDYVSNERQINEGGTGKVDSTQNVTGNNNMSRSGTDTDTHTGTDIRAYGENVKDILDATLDYINDKRGHTTNMEILEAIEKWRELIININQMIIGELYDLFMLVY